MNKRKHLTRDEIARLLNVVRQAKFAIRDECMIQICFFHGLRVSELIQLTLADIDEESGQIFIRRLKKGLCTIQPICPEERGILKKWLSVRKNWPGGESGWLFLSRLGTPLSRQQIYVLLKKYGLAAKLSTPVHPHMLRHACGYALADNGSDTRLIQDYLGHRNIRNTVIYTASNAGRFRGIWEKEGRGNLTFWPKLSTRINHSVFMSTFPYQF